jgi:hypothetical protein
MGRTVVTGTTNLAIYRSLVRTYPERNRRQLLLDLIKTRGDKGKWFAAAKDAGFLDIALECAALHNADPSTLVRAARDFCGKEPKFAAAVALFAATHLLTGGGYDPSVSDVNEAVKHLFAATRISADWLHLHAFPAARYSSKPQRSHCRDTTPRRPLPSRNPHEISCRDIARVIAAVLQRQAAPDTVSW